MSFNSSCALHLSCIVTQSSSRSNISDENSAIKTSDVKQSEAKSELGEQVFERHVYPMMMT